MKKFTCFANVSNYKMARMINALTYVNKNVGRVVFYINYNDFQGNSLYIEKVKYNDVAYRQAIKFCKTICKNQTPVELARADKRVDTPVDQNTLEFA